jgi:hypothetical protein
MKCDYVIRAVTIAGLLAALAVSAVAGTPIRLSFHDSTVVSGSTISYPVYADSSFSGYSVSAYQIVFTYNTSLFKFTGAVNAGTLTSTWGSPTVYEGPLGTVNIVGASSDTLIGNGKLVILQFSSPQFTGSYNQGGSFAFQSAVFNQGFPAVSFRNGSITLTPAPSIVVSPNTALLTKGDIQQFSVSGGKAPYTWASTSPSVASIDTLGKLRALSAGFTRVVVSSTGYVDTSGVIEVRSFKLSFRDTSRYQGQSVNLPVYCTDLTGLNATAGQFTVAFNNNLWSADTTVIQAGTILAGYSQPIVQVANGTVSVSFAGTTPLTGSGILVYLRMKARTSSYGGSSVSVQSALLNETIGGNVSSANLNVLQLAQPSVTPSGAQALVVGDSLRFSATGGTPPYTWSVSDSQFALITSTDWMKAKKSGTVTASVQDVLGGTGTSGVISLYDFRLTVPDTTMIPAAIVEVPVYISANAQGFLSYQLGLSYTNSAYVQMLAIDQAGTLSLGMTVSSSIDTVNRKSTIAAAGISSVTTGGVLIKLKFSVSASTPASLTTYITITGALFDEGIPLALSHNGSFKVTNRAVASLSPSTAQLQAPVDQADSTTFTVYNSGDIALTSSLRVLGSTAFTVSSTSLNTAPGDSSKFKAYFKPKVTGPDSAKIQLSTNDPLNSVLLIPVNGIGSPPVILPPTAPVLATPVDNAIGVPVSTSLSWVAVPGATTYRVQVSTSSTFTTSVVDDSTLTGTSRAVSGLANSTMYYWRVRAKNAAGFGAFSAARSFKTIGTTWVEHLEGDIPTECALTQNYPNPFNPSTTIQYDLAAPSHVTLEVYDALGQRAVKLVDEQQSAGTYRVRWDGSGNASGMYFYRLQVGDASTGSARGFSETRKMVLLH